MLRLGVGAVLVMFIEDLKQERTVQIAASDLVVIEGKVHAGRSSGCAKKK